MFISESERSCVYMGLAACVQEERAQMENKDRLRSLDFVVSNRNKYNTFKSKKVMIRIEF